MICQSYTLYIPKCVEEKFPHYKKLYKSVNCNVDCISIKNLTNDKARMDAFLCVIL